MKTFILMCGAYCAGALTVYFWDYIAPEVKRADAAIRAWIQSRKARP